MNCRPIKRLRTLNREVATAVAYNDPFGDDESFTQDDWNEIDFIASQAATSSTAGSGHGSKAENKVMEVARPYAAGQSKPLSTATVKQSRENPLEFGDRRNAGMSKEPLGEFRNKQRSWI